MDNVGINQDGYKQAKQAVFMRGNFIWYYLSYISRGELYASMNS